jgi:hypothetical protein
MKSKVLLTILVIGVALSGLAIAAAILNQGYVIEGIFGVITLIAIIKVYASFGWFRYIDENTPDTP